MDRGRGETQSSQITGWHVLKSIIIKLQKRVKAGAATLLIKVKTHRGDPINEEADIRAEIDRLKEESEKVWDAQTDRTIYQWSEPSKTKKGTLITKATAWTHTVRNRMRQKAREIQAFRALERGAEKWCREHTQRHESSPISEEGQNLLDNTDRWCDQTSILKECYESRKRERIHEDGSFRHHQKGQSRQHIHQTGSSDRENTEENWGND